MRSSPKWSEQDIPDLSGKVAVVTGGNAGLGFETVKALALKHAHVILACRNTAKGDAAREEVIALTPGASIDVIQLDLASLASIRRFAEALNSKLDQLHILINNAGVMATPRTLTADGFELQLGTNHLGHFALTGLLLPLLLRAPSSRVVTVSSTAELFGRISFNDLMGEKFYNRWIAYGQSKLANVLFANELQRRLEAANATAISLAVHPGFATTNLRTELQGGSTPFFDRVMAIFFEKISPNDSRMGALPQLYAATAPGVQGGEYYGPDGFAQLGGYPRRLRSSRRSHNKALALRLWSVSTDLTGVSYPV